MELFNLNFGDNRPPAGYDSVKVGPFTITAKQDYAQLAKLLPRPRTVTLQFGGKGKLSSGHKGAWVATADVTSENSNVQSILSMAPISDGGIWDLCSILTFLNGRRVITDSYDERFSPNTWGNKSCVDAEILGAAQVFWDNREKLVRRNLTYSLLLSNTAIALNEVNSQAGLVSAAFNAVYDDWRKVSESAKSGKFADLTKSEKVLIKRTLITALDTLTEVKSQKRERLKPLLGSKVDQGLGSPIDLIQSLLIDLKIIPATPNEKVVERIRFLNSVRNKFVHCGYPPRFTHKPELSVEISMVVINQIIPRIIAMYLGRIIGFTIQTVGSLAQHTYELEHYFAKGRYGNLNIEEESFSDMINELEAE